MGRVKITLVRYATLLLEVGGRRVLVDPMLGDAETQAADRRHTEPATESTRSIAPAGRRARARLDAVLVTHLHEDHFDEAAERILPKDVPVFCQPEDEGRLRSSGSTPSGHRRSTGTAP